MLTKIIGAVVISLVSAITTLLAQSLIASHGTSAAGKPHQTQATPQPCTLGGVGVHGHGVAGTVKSVSGNTITISTPGGTTVTVIVSGTTKYYAETGTSSLSAIHPGSTIVAKGSKGSNNSLNATAITIVPAHAGGKVTAINGSALTVQPPSGNLWKLASSVTTIVTNSGTKYFAPMSATAGFSEIKVGRYIAATGTLSSDGKTLTATRIIIAPAGFSLGTGGVAPHFMMHGMLRGMVRGIFHGMGMGRPFGFHHFWMNSPSSAQGTTNA